MTVTRNLKPLLDSLGLPVLAVDRQLLIRQFTPDARVLVNVVPLDVGRSITDLRWNVRLTDSDELVRECVERGTTTIRDIQDQDGVWRTLSIRPYRSKAGRIDGAVIVLSDAHRAPPTADASVLGSDLVHQQAVVEALAEAKTVCDGAPVVIESVCRKAGWRAGELWTLDARGRALRLAGSWPPVEKPAQNPARAMHMLSGSEGAAMARSAWADQKPIWVEHRIPVRRRARSPTWRSMLAVPIRRGQRAMGALLLLDVERHVQDEVFAARIDQLGRHIGAWIECKWFQEKIRTQENEYRQLSGRLLHLQDAERRRIARDLHDSAVQRLAALIMNLDLLARDAKRLDARTRRTVSESRTLAEQCATEIRTLTYLLHPPLLDEKGLVAAVQWFVAGFSERSGVRVDVDIGDLARLPERIEQTLYRVVQESFNNIHRHARTEQASIALKATHAAVTLAIRDRGRGIPADAGPGVGIQDMRERIYQLGGTFDLDTGRSGTTVRVRVPLKDGADADADDASPDSHRR